MKKIDLDAELEQMKKENERYRFMEKFQKIIVDLEPMAKQNPALRKTWKELNELWMELKEAGRLGSYIGPFTGGKAVFVKCTTSVTRILLKEKVA